MDFETQQRAVTFANTVLNSVRMNPAEHAFLSRWVRELTAPLDAAGNLSQLYAVHALPPDAREAIALLIAADVLIDRSEPEDAGPTSALEQLPDLRPEPEAPQLSQPEPETEGAEPSNESLDLDASIMQLSVLHDRYRHLLDSAKGQQLEGRIFDALEGNTEDVDEVRALIDDLTMLGLERTRRPKRSNPPA